MLAAHKYSQAIGVIQEQVFCQSEPDEALLISCLLLACAEVVQWRELNALTHLKGTMELLRSRGRSEGVVIKQDPEDESAAFTPKGELDYLVVQLDIQASSYALGLPPRFHAVDMRYLLKETLLPPGAVGSGATRLPV